MRTRRAPRPIPAPVVRGAHENVMVPVDEMPEEILHSPVGTVFLSGLGGSWWVCQRYDEAGGMYVWDGIDFVNYQSIYTPGCRDRSIWYAEWHPLLVVSAPEHDLAQTFGYPLDEFNWHRYEAMEAWKNKHLDAEGNVMVEGLEL